MREFEPEARIVVSDRQILPFRAGQRVPPPLAVTSLKRQWSGHLPGETLIAIIEEYRSHIQKEEDILYPWAKELVDDPTLADMTAAMRQRRIDAGILKSC